MNGKDFTSRLKKIKAEVLALKQYQKSGVGRANFYRYRFPVAVTPPGQYLITRFYFNSNTEPMFQHFTIFSNKTVTWNDNVLTIKDDEVFIGGSVIVIAQKPYDVEYEYANE